MFIYLVQYIQNQSFRKKNAWHWLLLHFVETIAWNTGKIHPLLGDYLIKFCHQLQVISQDSLITLLA